MVSHNTQHDAPATSYDTLRATFEDLGVKAIASHLRISAALGYKWCEPTADNSGAMNPLDRVRQIVRICGDLRPIHWLCEKAGGFFCANPVPFAPEARGRRLFNGTSELFARYAAHLKAISDSGEEIDAQEAARIRVEWEAVKRAGETFVVQAEAGNYRQVAGRLPVVDGEEKR